MMLFSLLSTSCKKEDNSDPIVLPAGILVQYSNEDFYKISGEFYSVELNKYDPNKKLFDVTANITPTADLSGMQTVNYTLPKDKDFAAGLFTIKVNMSRQTLNFESFVLPGRITLPGLVSTLTVELLRKYPNRGLETYRENTVLAIEAEIKKFIEEQNKKYPQIDKLEIQESYKFYKNGLSSNVEFLKVLEDYDINFDFDSNGQISAAPFPFGKKNSPPILDLSNSTPASKIITGLEKLEVFIRGNAVDSDGDYIIYAWKIDGQLVKSNIDTEFRWTPDYNGYKDVPYNVSLTVTDGGKDQLIEWKVKIDNFNRKPVATLNCPKVVKENETFNCQASAVDHDNEKMKFTLRDIGVSARATINGQKTDDITRSVVIPNVSSVDLVYTPNNNDALTRSAYFQIEVEDEGGAITSIPIVVAVDDSNKPPEIIGGIQAINSSTDHEWDHCALNNPDGGMNHYDFYVTLTDPDNQNGTVENGYDIIASPRLSGSLNCTGIGCVEPLTCPVELVSTPIQQYYCFRWKPSETKKAGVLGFVLRDNHGGNSDLLQFNLVAEDRNQKPCLNTIASAGNMNLSVLKPDASYVIKAYDNDFDFPMMSLTSNQSVSSSDVYPFLFDVFSNKNIIFRKKISGNTLSKSFYRTRNKDIDFNGGSFLNMRINFESKFSGVVKFFRPTGFASAVTIPKDVIIETQSSLMPYLKMKYKTAVDVVIEPDDIEVWVPVIIFDQSVGIGQINSMKSVTLSNTAVSASGLTITNPAALDENGVLTITRSNTATALVLPKNIEFFSSNELSPTVSSVRYFNYSSISFNIGQASATVNVSKVKAHLNQNSASTNNFTRNSAFAPYIDYLVSSSVSNPQNAMTLSTSLADSSLRVAYEDLYNYINFSLYPMNGEANRSITLTAEDSYKLPVGATLKDQNGDQYRVSSDFLLYGNISLERLGSLSNPLSNNLFLAASTTEFTAVNGSKYILDSDVIYPANSSSVVVSLQRKNHTNPVLNELGQKVGIINFSFTDSNFRPSFISPSGAMNLTVNEGQKINDYLLEVNDNPTNPGLPNDPYDRHSFNITLQSATAPRGQISFCREKGDSLTSIGSPTCTPCSTQIASDYWDSARCFVRYFPNNAQNSSNSDIDETYTYLVDAQDNSAVTLGQAHNITQVLNVKVNETNDAPVMTDSLWAPLTSSLVSPHTCGGVSCGDFVENNYLDFAVYATDPDKNSLNKKLTFSVHTQVYDLKDSRWINRPGGLGVVNEPAVSTNVYGGQWGSRYRGRIFWTPNDWDAKFLAGSAGFIIKVNVTDEAALPSPKLTASAYYKVTVKNINNPPILVSPLNFTIIADQYFKNSTSIVLADRDAIEVPAHNFATSLSLCQSTSVFTCTAPIDGWPDEIKFYDANYSRNSAIAQCRTGANLNTQLALPYLTRGSARYNGTIGRREYPYQLEWCAQRSQLGLHDVYLHLNDNGDKDRNNLLQPQHKLVSAMILNVQAPIFFSSPKKNNSDVVVNAPTQAFVGRPFLYQTLIKNTKKSNVRFQLLEGPSGMTLDNNSTIKNDNSNAIGVGLNWTPLEVHLTTGNPLAWHKVTLKVFDTTNNIESDTVSFLIKVKSPISPVQKKPILTKLPNLASVIVDEKVHNNFSILASDENPDDRLFYSWFVDNIKVYDEGSNFDYFPSLNSFGKHTIRVDVSDGFYVESASWTVNVRNTVPNILNSSLPEFDIFNYNSTKLAKTITSLSWSTETKVETVSGVDTFNSILFSGSYTKNGTHNDFVYNLKLKNGLVSPALAAGSAGNPLLAESLPWNSGNDSKRISYKKSSGTSFSILVTPLLNRNESFTTALTKAVCLPQTLGFSSSGFNPTHICSSASDANELFKNEDSYGNIVAAVFVKSGVKYDVTISNDFRNLLWTGSSAPKTFFDSTLITDCGFTGCGNGLRLYGIAVSNKNNRIYATARDIANGINKLLVFDSTPLLSSNDPNLIATLNINDGVNSDNKASEVIVINDTVNGVAIDKVFVMLPGTGGLAVLPDSTRVPINSDLSFIGNTGSVGKSGEDAAGTGRKLVYNSGSKLIYGLVKGSNQVFSLDVRTHIIQVQPITLLGGLDSIQTFNNDQNTYGISRTLGQIFRLQ